MPGRETGKVKANTTSALESLGGSSGLDWQRAGGTGLWVRRPKGDNPEEGGPLSEGRRSLGSETSIRSPST